MRFVRLWFTDVLGQLKSFAITPAELESALEEGMTFDGSAIEGYSRVQESDMLAVPDPNTFEIVPWRGDDAPVARMFCDVAPPLGRAVRGRPALRAEAQPRARPGEGLHVLRRARDGVLLLPSRRRPDAARPRRLLRPHPASTWSSNLRKQTILTLEAMGIPVEYSFHELGPSQHEIDLRYTDALTMADNVMTFRHRREGGGARPRRVRDVHAQAHRRRRSARGCTRTCRCSRATSTRSTTPATSTGCRRSGKASSPGCSGTRARSPRSRTSG